MPDGSNRPSYGPHPDAVLLRQRRMERARTVVRLALAMATPLSRKPGRAGKAKVCPGCKTAYPIRRGPFGPSGCYVYCVDCKPLARDLGNVSRATKGGSKRCVHCGEQRPRDEFYRNAKMHKTCNGCAESVVRAKIEARLARNGARNENRL